MSESRDIKQLDSLRTTAYEVICKSGGINESSLVSRNLEKRDLSSLRTLAIHTLISKDTVECDVLTKVLGLRHT